MIRPGRKRHVSEHVGLGLVEEAGKLPQLRAELICDLAPLRSCGPGIVLGKRGGDEGRDDTPGWFHRKAKKRTGLAIVLAI
jgi:hypothetical protein